MSEADFSKVMEDGFGEITTGADSTLRCYNCGIVTELKKIKMFTYKIICSNNHQFELIDYITIHSKIKKEIAEKAMSIATCENAIDEQYADFNNEENYFC